MCTRLPAWKIISHCYFHARNGCTFLPKYFSRQLSVLSISSASVEIADSLFFMQQLSAQCMVPVVFTDINCMNYINNVIFVWLKTSSNLWFPVSYIAIYTYMKLDCSFDFFIFLYIYLCIVKKRKFQDMLWIKYDE